MVRMIASRSSPLTRSRFLTKNGSRTAAAEGAPDRKESRSASVARSRRSASWMRLACLRPMAITPRDMAGRWRAWSATSSTTRVTSSVTESSWPRRPGGDGIAAVRAVDAGERGQGPVVEVGLGVGEGDEALVPGPVVPGQGAGAGRRRELEAHDVEDRFHVAGPGHQRGGVVPLVFLGVGGGCEEAGRGELTGVAGHDRLGCP